MTKQNRRLTYTDEDGKKFSVELVDEGKIDFKMSFGDITAHVFREDLDSE